MWGRAVGGGRLLPLLLLLLPGAVGLECLSCGAEDGTCRGAQNVTCPTESDACAEASAALTWSHGRLLLGGRGCGRGEGGANARALPLPPAGLVLFVRRRQCRGGRGCNGLIPLGGEGALPLPGNASAEAANGLRCFGCPDDGPCSAPAPLRCYGPLRGCFRGNLTLTLGGVTVWREVRGCSRDPQCGPESVGDDVVGLSVSCCPTDLCNDGRAPPQPHNQTFFAPDRPRLQLLPHGQPPTDTPTKMADGPPANGTDATALPHGAAGRGGGGNGSQGAEEEAATQANVAATRANMAAGGNGVTGGANGVTGGANGLSAHVNMAAVDPNMATVDPNMATADPNMAAVDPNMATADPNMAAVDPNMAAADPNMAAADPNMAAVDPSMAAADPNMAAADPNMAAGGDKMAAGGDKMAAGRSAGGGGASSRREEGPKGGIKGRGHPIGGPGWLLPLLLLPLL